MAKLTAELQKLSTIECLTPKDKADVLVHAHKIAVGEWRPQALSDLQMASLACRL